MVRQLGANIDPTFYKVFGGLLVGLGKAGSGSVRLQWLEGLYGGATLALQSTLAPETKERGEKEKKSHCRMLDE